MSDEMEGGIWASCGCKLEDHDGPDGHGFTTIFLGNDADFDGPYRYANYGSACLKCYMELKNRNAIATREEADRWIATGEYPERMRGSSE